MPVYIYENPNTGELEEVVQTMSEPHVYFKNDVQWSRVFVTPSAKVDSLENCDPFNKQDFLKRTARPGMTMGDMWNESARLSEKRASALGKDPIKEKAIKSYETKTKKPHPHANKIT
jgi:hypothetical protein